MKYKKLILLFNISTDYMKKKGEKKSETCITIVLSTSQLGCHPPNYQSYALLYL